MLTPAIFEDRMRAIRMSAKDTPTMLYQAHQLMAEALEARGIRARALGQEEISELIERARFGGIGLPYLVGHAVTFGMEEA